MVSNNLILAALFAISVGGIAYVFIYPLLSGEARAEKRQKAIADSGLVNNDIARANSGRRNQVSQSLKELEAREQARGNLTLEMRIQQAGLEWTKAKLVLFGIGCAVVLGLVSLILFQNLLASLGFAFIGAFGVPFWMLSFLKKRRIQRFNNELPNALDVIVRGIKAGLPLADCIRIISTEAQEPLRTEFRRIIEGQALGISVADSCAKLYERIPVSEVNFFYIVIAIQQKSGGNLSEALGNLSRVVRERRKMRNKINAMSMEAKASAVIIAAMPVMVALMTYFSSPSYIELMWKTQAGIYGLIASGFWMLMGILTMRKMINFDF